jgi:hypothetical protein
MLCTYRASWLALERASHGCSARTMSPEFLPPEVLVAAGGRDGQTADSGLAGRDAWTLGAALHVMLTGAGTLY